ncbi:MAG: hypothetical protein F6J92_40935 [Symploca sp. SIO1A3]|nr:hypothetical protein [Symploca sp. SIO2C1]NER52899.1 hypothetical protein [Symploca sp. SIO1A3]
MQQWKAIMQQWKAPPVNWQSLVTSSCLLLIGYLLAVLELPLNPPLESTRERPLERSSICTEIVQPDVVVSQEQLNKLSDVPTYTQRDKVKQILKQPYCRLPALNIRVGAITEREAYPLAFDPQTSLVVLYEGKNYVGYGFKRL